MTWRFPRPGTINNVANENGRGNYTFPNIFNIDSLMNYDLPRHVDGVNSFGNSSQGESRSSQGMFDHANGFVDERSVDSSISRKRKRPTNEDCSTSISSLREEPNSNGYDSTYDTHISEEKYHSMLDEHAQRYHRMRQIDTTPSLLSSRTMVPVSKHNYSRAIKSGNGSFTSAKGERVTNDLGNSLEYCDLASENGAGSRFTSSTESPYLDMGDGITYNIPPIYEKLADSLHLPSLSNIRVDENYLNGKLDMQSLATMIAQDRKYHFKNDTGMGDPVPQYKSLQARLKASPSYNSLQKFSLQVTTDSLAIPEGAAGKIRRLILSESGTLQVHHVRIMEKGDTYEIIERSLPKKQIAVKDPSLIEREEIDKIRKFWSNMARKEIPRHHRYFNIYHRKRVVDAKRFSETCQKEVKLKVTRSLRYMKQTGIRTRKLTRETQVFYKRMDKEQAELRKKEEKEAAEALKREEEFRETKRQQQRLSFLLSQTELYSHFMQNKSPQGSEIADQVVKDPTLEIPFTSDNELEGEENAELKREALQAAKHAVSQQKKLTNAFDSECLKLRQVGNSNSLVINDSVGMESSDINLLNPSTMPITSSVQTPEMFKGTLKDYQLKGLQWLVNCYEQGLNGILADEMGLGKTIQAMAFLAHLAEEKNIWGPFLVVAPSSVLNNWVDEINRFCPNLKTLPYWGPSTERAVLRKNINPKRLYKRESPFHILITSYQILVFDEKCLRRVKWQYMVLDEAQAIKSSTSIRWKTLLSFNCRNRLLLTGTPIQNNMAELWALLHFIMPTLFDSHDQFNEWFSKGIENHAEHGVTLNEHQLSRLHGVLKPFMLRRVKKDVISEMTAKTEVTVRCTLSSRQNAFYQAIKNKFSLSELINVSRGGLSDKKILNLMNIVIQLRKVCNHPELFERNEGTIYVFFADIPNSLLPPPFGEPGHVHYPGGRNPITYKLPQLVYQDLIRTGVSDLTKFWGLPSTVFKKLNIFSADNVFRSIFYHNEHLGGSPLKSGTFGFARLIELSPHEISFLADGSILERSLFSLTCLDRMFFNEMLDTFLDTEADDLDSNMGREKVRAISRMLLIPTKSDFRFLRRKHATGPCSAPFEELVTSHHDRFVSNTKLLREIYAFIPRVLAPLVNVVCHDGFFSHKETEDLHNPWIKKLLIGYGSMPKSSPPRSHPLIEEIDSELSFSQPALKLTYDIFGSCPPIQNSHPAKMLADSGKLKMLDMLLKQLRSENHRVLLFAQMTKMLDILQGYMNYRKYKYLRLDGSSSIADRRDMVCDFQKRSDIFVFLLSTRAGGLGINLTAADTVIFYESDWNPTLDLQAMDRAHRLGQTKEVTVYRLICNDTVEEKILKRASQKNTVQQLVMNGGHVQGDLLKSEDVVSLLLDDVSLEQQQMEIPLQAKDKQKKKRSTKGVRMTTDGDATLENLDEDIPAVLDESNPEIDTDVGASTFNSKKRKSASKPPSSKSNKRTKTVRITNIVSTTELEDDDSNIQPNKSKKTKKKSVNGYLEPEAAVVAGFPAIPSSSQQFNECHQNPPPDLESSLSSG